MKQEKIEPVILWDGEEEIITCKGWVERGDLDHQLLALLETTAVYRDVLLRDPEGMKLADPNQARMVDRGYRTLTNRLIAINDPVDALIKIAQIQLAIENEKNTRNAASL